MTAMVMPPLGALVSCYPAHHRSFLETLAVGVFLFTIEGKEVTRRGQTISYYRSYYWAHKKQVKQRLIYLILSTIQAMP